MCIGKVVVVAREVSQLCDLLFLTVQVELDGVKGIILYIIRKERKKTKVIYLRTCAFSILFYRKRMQTKL